MRIAVVGAGISGLTAALNLSDKFDVTLIEANDYIGGHTQTVQVEYQGEQHAIDTGFIVFNDRTYPNFCDMLAELKVATQPTSMTFSVRCDRSGLEYRGADLNGFFAQRKNLLSARFWSMLRDLVRFNRIAGQQLPEIPETMTVGEFFRDESFSQAFINYYFFPMGSAVWSAPPDEFSRFPVRSIIEFYRNHGLLSARNRPQWRVVRGGSQQYVKRLLRRLNGEVLTRTPVQSVRRSPHGVQVMTKKWQREFSHVVFACHADQALKILGTGATKTERQILGHFPYQKNVAVLHTDTAVLPRCRRAWASWNYRLPDSELNAAAVTYNMNKLQRLATRHTYCVTLNPLSELAYDKIIAGFEYEHPLFTSNRLAAQRRHSELIDHHRTSFCGAYWGHGFHEDGVNSALAVCHGLRRVNLPNPAKVSLA